MLKFIAPLVGEGTLYGFAFSEANLNRMEFNDEPIFFSFDYAYHPELHGLILYFPKCETPEDIENNFDEVNERSAAFLNEKRGITIESLRVFPIANQVLQNFRNKPYWGLEAAVEIAHPADKQVFFAGRTETEIEQYLVEQGLITSSTKRSNSGRGFGHR